MTDDRYTHREAVLDAAREATTKARNNSYGPPTQDFDRSASILNALGFRVNGERIRGHHIAMIQMAVKLSRITWTPDHQDSWVDLAGYAACGYECAVTEKRENGAHYKARIMRNNVPPGVPGYVNAEFFNGHVGTTADYRITTVDQLNELPAGTVVEVHDEAESVWVRLRKLGYMWVDERGPGMALDPAYVIGTYGRAGVVR